MAFPTPESERGGETGLRLANWESKAGYERDNHIEPDTRQVDSGDLIDLDSIINLTGKMDASGQLSGMYPKAIGRSSASGMRSAGFGTALLPRKVAATNAIK